MRISDWSSDVGSSDLRFASQTIYVKSLCERAGKEGRLRLGACRGGTDLPDCAPSRHASIRMRLNKHISDTGFCSRREADRLIGEGRVTVNGQRARIGAEVGVGDEVKVDGQALRARSAAKGQRRHVYIALNKPVGITCTTESAVKGTIVDFVGPERRIFPIGPLDTDSEGDRKSAG